MSPNEPRNETPRDDATPARQRIAKLMARVGLCSRRDAEVWIVEGRVSLNGSVLTSPATDVGPDDAILVDGAPLPAAEKTRLFLFHKPRGFITTDNDPEGRATVADYLREHWPAGPRVVTIGRLDFNTEGLLLLTNDGGLARLLELPKTGWVRRYRVRAKGETDQGVLDGLRDGITIEGIDYAGIEATLDRTQGANVWLTMALREGKNREVKRVLEAIGLEVNRLIRLSFGPFQLAELAEGAVEEVRTRVLRDQLGPTLAAAAGVAFEDAPAPQERKPVRPERDGREASRPARRDERGERRTDGRGAQRPDGRDGRGGGRPDGRDERAGGRRDTRGGERTLRRPREQAAEPAPIRERPAAGTRKHVSTLRSEEADAARSGPRRRIERSDVKDRRDRTVPVERMVGARLAPTRTRDGARPTPRDEAGSRRPLDKRQASPSALAKRARTERSGARDEMPRESRRGAARDAVAEPRRRDRPGDERPRGDGASRRSDRERGPRAGAPRSESERPGGTSRRTGPGEQRSAGARGAKDRDNRRAGVREVRKFERKRPDRAGEGRPERRAERGETPRRGERAADGLRATRPARASDGRRPETGETRRREPGDGGPKRFGGERSEARGAHPPRTSEGRAARQARKASPSDASKRGPSPRGAGGKPSSSRAGGKPSSSRAGGKPPGPRPGGRPPRGKPRPKG